VFTVQPSNKCFVKIHLETNALMRETGESIQLELLKDKLCPGSKYCVEISKNNDYLEMYAKENYQMLYLGHILLT
jgi:hypothetical protein